MTTSGLATAGGGTGTVTNTYGYDLANRLTSWTATPAGGTASTKTYGYDNSGNLINNNGVTQTYDARNELTSDSNGNSYTYAADGDIATQSSPGNANYSFSSDAYGQQITDGFSSFAWDALGRVTSAGEAFNQSYSVALTYDGMTSQVASDPSATYSRDPAGQIVGVDTTSGVRTLALVDQHDDLSGTFAATGTSLASSTTWDPWGSVLASTGPAIQAGYQGQWTDPVTQQVGMGSRFYRPLVGGFINADTVPAAGGNSHAYVGDNPMSLTDPTGHSPSSDGPGNGTITKAQVNAAAAKARDAKQAAARAEIAAANARDTAAKARSTASAAVRYAAELNNQASQLHSEWELANAAANQAKAKADEAHRTYLQAEATAQAYKNAIGSPPTPPAAPLRASANMTNLGNPSAGGGTVSISLGCQALLTNSGLLCSHPFTTSSSSSSSSVSSGSSSQSQASGTSRDQENAYNRALAAYHQRVNNYLHAEAIAKEDYAAWQKALRIQKAAEAKAQSLWAQYSQMHNQAVDAQHQAERDLQIADQAEARARSLTADAADAEKVAAQDEQQYLELLSEYNQQQRKENQGGGNSGSGNNGGNPTTTILPGGPASGCASGPDAEKKLCRKEAAAAADATAAAAAAINSLVAEALNSIPACISHPTVVTCAVAAVTGIVLIGSVFAGAGDAAAGADQGATLRTAVDQKASEVIASQSNRVRGPVLSGAMDTKTGEIFFGQNTGIPDPLHPLLRQRLDSFSGPGAPAKGIPGAHSEINAVNQGLFARPGSQIGDFTFYSVRLRGTIKGQPIEMCPNCAQILGGG